MSVLQMAMEGGITYDKIRNYVFAHPTYSESLNNLFMALKDWFLKDTRYVTIKNNWAANFKTQYQYHAEHISKILLITIAFFIISACVITKLLSLDKARVAKADRYVFKMAVGGRAL